MSPDAHGGGYWNIPREWSREACFVLAGGPSLKGFDADCLRDFRVIAVNNSYLLAPWADVLYFGDRRWYEWHKDKLADGFHGKYMVSRGIPGQKRALPVKILRYTGQNWSRERDSVGGRDSGHGALNLAALMGADPVFLLGFDMRQIDGENNWHEMHRVQAPPEKYGKTFIPNLNEAAKAIRKWGGPRVFNCTPGSALRCFPFLTVAQAILYARSQKAINGEAA